MASARSAWRSTNVTFRRSAACETIRSGTPSSASSIRPNAPTSEPRLSPTRQTMAISRSQVTSANSDNATRIASSCR